MFKHLVLVFVIIYFHVNLSLTSQSDTSFATCPIVETTQGLLQGAETSCGDQCSYCRYIGIPYAEPPLGNLRFKAPLPHSGWGTDIRNASEHGNICTTAEHLGDEDCLFLNVYTKSIDNNIGDNKLPVMFWIHGGAYMRGSGNSNLFGPDFLIDENVILVTVNYRLGALGFLSTNDRFATGNYGLKDVVLALKWTKTNIERFGGDSDDITIFGESAGGSIVHFLILSPVARNLFSKAIAQSGSALNTWAFQPEPEKSAHKLAQILNIEFSDNEDLINQLINVPVPDLINASNAIELPIPSGLHPFPFGPCKDPDDDDNISVNDRFLPKNPIDIMLSGDFNRSPFLNGFNSDEMLVAVLDIQSNADIIRLINAEPYRLIPPMWNVDVESMEAQEIAYEIREFYFYGQDLSIDLRLEYSMFISDLMFIVGIDKTSRIHASLQRQPLYYYKFSYDGDLNIAKALLLYLDEYPGAIHADDLYYLFKADIVPPTLVISESSDMTRRRMVRMWTNFAKTGNPTLRMDPITTTRWMPIRNGLEYLHINDTLVMENFPLQDRMEFWNRLEEKFVN